MRLKSRQLQIPNGFMFRQPEIKWDSRTKLSLHPSFDTLVRAVMSARKANPHHTEKHKWATDYDNVANEVDSFNAKVAMSMPGGNRFVAEVGGGAPPPFYQPPSPQQQEQLSAVAQKAKKIWAGVRTLNSWLDSGEPPVPTEQSDARAQVCIACPLNGKGDLTSWFTAPAAASISRQIERMHQRNISGSNDDKLNICTACLCPLKLKTKTPMKFIKPHLSDEVANELRKGKDCWILKEMEAQ